MKEPAEGLAGGGKFAATLLRGICADVEAGTESRKGAAGRLVEALGGHQALPPPDMLIGMLEEVNRSLSKRGMASLPTAFLGRLEAVPDMDNNFVHDVAHRLHAVCSIVEEVRKAGIPCSMSSLPPWHEDYRYEQDGELGIWMRAPTGEIAESRWAIGCIVLGADACQHLDFMLSGADGGGRALASLMPSASPGAMPLLRRLDEAIRDVCLTLARVPANSSLALNMLDHGPVATWGGDVVVHDLHSQEAEEDSEEDAIPLEDGAFLGVPSP